MTVDSRLTTAAAAQRLRIDPSLVRRLCSRGVIAGEKFGRDWSIPESEVERYAANRPKPGRPRTKLADMLTRSSADIASSFAAANPHLMRSLEGGYTDAE